MVPRVGAARPVARITPRRLLHVRQQRGHPDGEHRPLDEQATDLGDFLVELTTKIARDLASRLVLGTADQTDVDPGQLAR